MLHYIKKSNTSVYILNNVTKLVYNMIPIDYNSN